MFNNFVDVLFLFFFVDVVFFGDEVSCFFKSVFDFVLDVFVL